MNNVFVCRRRILWGDSDPAGVIYTPRVFHYAIETVEEWLIKILGHNWMSLQSELKLDTPTVKMGCEFFHPLRTGDFVDISLKIEKMGNASIHYAIKGFNEQKIYCFEVKQVSCFVNAETFKAISIPRKLRIKLEKYQTPSND
jgi:4-hydroxybenzoyl-CoA thioesterase